MRRIMPTSVPHRVAVVSFQMHVFSSSWVHTFVINPFPLPTRLIHQHITECHDPLAELLRERGEKTVCINTQP